MCFPNSPGHKSPVPSDRSLQIRFVADDVPALPRASLLDPSPEVVFTSGFGDSTLSLSKDIGTCCLAQPTQTGVSQLDPQVLV
jgi:hypothetical protein